MTFSGNKVHRSQLAGFCQILLMNRTIFFLRKMGQTDSLMYECRILIVYFLTNANFAAENFDFVLCTLIFW